jgi:phage terminase large subunit
VERKPFKILPAFADFIQPARFKVAYGGRGSAKTHEFSKMLIKRVRQGARAVCAREIMLTLEQSVYAELEECAHEHGIHQDFVWNRGHIFCPSSGGSVGFVGLWNNKQKVKGYSKVNIAWIEEAEPTSAGSWKDLIPTIREPHSEIWATYNPENPYGYIHSIFVTRPIYPEFVDGKPYCIVRKINSGQNPYFPAELRLDMELMKERNYDLYRHVYLGEPVPDSERGVIKHAWVMSAIDAHKKLGIVASGERVAALDVADEGKDKDALAFAHGILLLDAFAWSGKGSDIMQTTRRAVDYCRDNDILSLTYDADGIGAGVRGDATHILDGSGFDLNLVAFRGSGEVINPLRQMVAGRKNQDYFANRKAQAWWSLRLRLEATHRAVNGAADYDPDQLVSISSDIDELDQLCSDLCQPTWAQSAVGKLLIDKQPGGTLSPNLGDSVMMALAPTRQGYF